MRVLAIDTSRGACSAAVYDAAMRYTFARESEPMQRGHSEALAPMVERVLKETDGGAASLTKIAVAIGPGSFTGLAHRRRDGAGDGADARHSRRRRLDADRL